MYNPKHFFEGYVSDYHYQKVVTLKTLLDNESGLQDQVMEIFKEMDEKDVPEKERYVQWVRAEIRSTYYHAIETLFELIRALYPRGNKIDNQNIWLYFSTSKYHKTNEWIDEVAKGELSVLDGMVRVNDIEGENPVEVSFGQYLFYFAVNEEEILDKIATSLELLKEVLQEFAYEFSDRKEYNALKHGLRLFPTMKALHYKTEKAGEWKPLIQAENSMTYLTSDAPNEITLHLAPMDTDRDVSMTSLCSALISSIITTRAFRMGIDSKRPNVVPVLTRESWDSLRKRNVKYLDFKMKISSQPDEN